MLVLISNLLFLLGLDIDKVMEAAEFDFGLEVKQEPIDPDVDDPPEQLEDYDEAFNSNSVTVKRRRTEDEGQFRKLMRFSVDQVANERHQQELNRISPAAPSTAIDSSITFGKRQAFLGGSIQAADLIQASSTATNYQPAAFQEIRKRTGYAQKLLETPRSSFYSNDPRLARHAVGSQQQVSPLIAARFNSRFPEQATTDNIRSALLGQNYRNIPEHLQTVGQRIGVDLNAISQQMQPPERAPTENSSYIANHRSTSMQTDPVEAPEPSRREVRKNLKSVETQTTKNTGIFTYTLDSLSSLSSVQRKALEDFKKVKKNENLQIFANFIYF